MPNPIQRKKTRREPKQETILVIGQKDEKEQVNLYLDSGATCHIFKQANLLTNITTSKCNVRGVSGKLTNTDKIGDLLIKAQKVPNNNKILRVKNFRLMPNAAFNLLSVSKLTERGCKVVFSKNTADIFLNGQKILHAQKDETNLYKVVCIPYDSQTTEKAFISIQELHEKMGHLSEQQCRKLIKHNMIEGLKLTKGSKFKKCIACAKGKQKRRKHCKEVPPAKNKGDLIFSDLSGKISPPSFGGHKYYMSFIDSATRYSWIYFLKKKSEALDVFKSFNSHFKTQHERKIKSLRTDNGGEFITTEFSNYLKSQGITRPESPPYSPELQALAERLNQTLMGKARSMMYATNMEKRFWAEAVSTANLLRNISPTKVHASVTPFEALFNRKPKSKHLHIFGQPCTYKDNRQIKKLAPRSKEGLFLGYSLDTSSFRVWSTSDRRMIISRDVQFFASDENTTRENYEFVDQNQPLNDSGGDESSSSEVETQSYNTHNESIKDQIEFSTNSSSTSSSSSSSISDQDYTMTNESQDTSQSDDGSQPASPTIPRRSDRLQGKTFEQSDNSESRLFKEIGLLSLTPTDKSHPLYEPKSFKDMQKSEFLNEWQKATDEEYESLMKMGTWSLVTRPKNSPVVKSKWVFKCKLKSDRTLERYKARLVAKGFTQTHGVDYFETFAPVVKMSTLQYVLSHALNKGWPIEQMDVKVAFLNGDLDCDIYMEQPEGYVKGKDKVCKLNKAIYGLKQSARQWYQKFTNLMLKNQFTQSHEDPCLFIHQRIQIIVAIFVDDCTIAGTPNQVKIFKKFMTDKFEMRDLGKINYLLGIKIDHKNDMITLNQSSYIQTVLERFKMTGAKPMYTPSEKWLTLEGEPVDQKLYQQAVGSLMFLQTATRPDLSFSVNQVARFMHDPREPHWVAVKRILRYLVHSQELKLVYNKKKPNQLVGYADASFANDVTDRKSTSGYAFMTNGGAVSWRSRKQKLVTSSAMEAEYVSLYDATKEALWYKKLLCEIHGTSKPIIILEDNQPAINLSKNPVVHDRSKHIDTKYHVIRQHQELGDIKIEYCCTESMIADIFTKPLGRVKFEQHRQSLGLYLNQDKPK